MEVSALAQAYGSRGVPAQGRLEILSGVTSDVKDQYPLPSVMLNSQTLHCDRSDSQMCSCASVPLVLDVVAD